MQTCTKCGLIFEEKGKWQKICTVCFKLLKQQELENLKLEIKTLNNKIYRLEKIKNTKLDYNFLISLIKLCHPDKHNNSNLSNEITKKLIEMKEQKSGKYANVSN